MEIRKAIIDEIMNCKWLHYCGEQQYLQYDFEVYYEKDYSMVMKTITSSDWENICLEESGNITAYLSLHNKIEYNKNWNLIAKKVKSEILPDIIEKIQEGANMKNLSECVVNDIKFNLVTIIISDTFSHYYRSEFYHHLYQVYLSGHLPCGWEGEFPKGRLTVF